MRMKPSQSYIFWLDHSRRDEVEHSKCIERLLAHGYEVLYVIKEVGDYVIAPLTEFSGKRFQDITEEEFTLEACDTLTLTLRRKQ